MASQGPFHSFRFIAKLIFRMAYYSFEKKLSRHMKSPSILIITLGCASAKIETLQLSDWLLQKCAICI